MIKRSAIVAALTAVLSNTCPAKIWFDDIACWGLPTVRRTCPKTVSAAALKRAAKKRRNIRARSKK